MLLTTVLHCLSAEEKHSRQTSKCKAQGPAFFVAGQARGGAVWTMWETVKHDGVPEAGENGLPQGFVGEGKELDFIKAPRKQGSVMIRFTF